MKHIGIIGGGAWGTALSLVCRRAGLDVTLQAMEPDVAGAINNDHENPLYLPGIDLDPKIRATTDIGDAASSAEALLLVAPAQFARAVMETLAESLKDSIPLVICAKGIEQETCALMSEIAQDVLPDTPVAILSGPTFAAEVARDLPTGVTLATADEALGVKLSDAIGTPRFRIYRSDDIIGAQIGGAVKNVLAIACGIVEGRDLGDNTRAALITRGLAEIVRLSEAKGGRAETLMGLSGIGDLVLTCNAMQSRNFSLGVALGQGQALADIQASRNSVAEGVFSAASVTELARRLDVDMPICLGVDGVLNNFTDIDATIESLLSRPTGIE